MPEVRRSYAMRAELLELQIRSARERGADPDVPRLEYEKLLRAWKAAEELTARFATGPFGSGNTLVGEDCQRVQGLLADLDGSEGGSEVERLARARALAAVGEWSKSDRVLETLSASYCDDASYHTARSRILCRLGLPLQALDACERALELDATLADGHSARGLALLSLDRIEEALVSLGRAVDGDARAPETHVLRGEALLRLGREEEAAQAYERANRLDENDPRSQFGRGSALARLGQYEEAVLALERALDLGGLCPGIGRPQLGPLPTRATPSLRAPGGMRPGGDYRRRGRGRAWSSRRVKLAAGAFLAGMLAAALLLRLLS